MINKYFFGALAVAVLITSVSVTAFAQVGELRGHVWMQQADGQKVPLADAQIDVYRTDMNAKYQTKTNKKGEFVFAGLPFIGTYAVAASHPTAAPNFVPGVKAGREIPCEITVTPGNGKRLTYEDIKAAGGTTAPAPGGAAPAPSAADKAKMEELRKKNEEIEAGNKKITEANEIISRTFKAGNEALTAASAAAKANNTEEAIGKYTEAVSQYDQGLAADPEQPAILTNKSVALKARGVARYNAAVKSTDDAAKNSGIQQAKADFKAAAEAAGKAATMIKAQPAPTDAADVQRYNANKYAAFVTYAESMRLYVTKGDPDPAKADAGVTAFKDYIAVETDPAKKAKAQLDMAQMLLDAGDADKALAEFKAILATTPDSAAANLGAGLAVYATGDKAKFQEAANFLARFVELAPDSDPMKADAKAILTELKNTENVTPEKTSRPPRKPRP